MSCGKEMNIYQGLFDRIHVGIYQTNNDNKISIANPAFAKTFGYESPDDIIGKDIREFYIDPARRQEFKNELTKGGGYVTGYLARMKKKGGEPFYALIDSHIITNEEGEEIGIEGILRNAPERFVDLQKMVDDRDTFMQNISHELRTPMTTVLAAAENIQRGITTGPDIPKALKKIEIELQRLNLMTERLSRAELIARGLSECHPSKLNIYEHLSISRTLMTPLAERKNITIEIEDEIKKWPPLQIDHEMFKHAILNLLDNGIKYSYPGSSVRIYGYQHWGQREIMVQNRGIPILFDEYDKIFERYYRTKSAIAVSPTGSGIGLMLVKDFVEKHNAKIQVKSAPISEKSAHHLNSFLLIFPR